MYFSYCDEINMANYTSGLCHLFFSSYLLCLLCTEYVTVWDNISANEVIAGNIELQTKYENQSRYHCRQDKYIVSLSGDCAC